MISYRYTIEIMNANLRLSQPSRRRHKFWLYNSAEDKVAAGYPKNISSEFKAIPDSDFPNIPGNLDSVFFDKRDGNLYFFKGNLFKGLIQRCLTAWANWARALGLVSFSTLPDDEAHFWLNGYVNKQNCRIWSEANPQVYVETPLHPEKLTVWCALWAGGIIGPYFFKNDEGHNVTVNGDWYRAMITNFFIPELNNHDVQELWFQQDGATCHTARATIDLLKDTFGDRLISPFGPVNWPPRSCDLTPLDYFLWGYVKSLVYADKPQTLDHLEDNIRRVIADIRRQMLEKVIENWTSRLDYIRASRGSPMPEIIFKM
ncbi:DDE_3 domain-containing protein [Trichonephila clavipes]|uniref:DDE_3 domain-containing protein n=1 Tax=Trichonephila clavipes TaxID=2585209 RepID=A0A8X6WI73_TRICX|nr:DDE_3 domain-containing protein [Trichonephila clavipes]